MTRSASVVVPAFEEAQSLSRCLDSLDGQNAEVVVVAGGEDDTAALARGHAAVDTVVVDEGRGAGAARNRGVEAASGDVVLFTDADTTVPPDWVERHRRHYDDPNVVGVGGPARPLDGSLRDTLLYRLFSDWWYRLSWPAGLIQSPTFNCSYWTAAFREHGGFDEELPFIEDTDLSMRLRDAGGFVYDPETRVATSARREREEGYLSLFLLYLRAYVAHYVLGWDLDGDYFDSG